MNTKGSETTTEWKQVIKYYFPEFDDEDCHNFLWSCTAFPFSSVRKTYEQIYRKYRQAKSIKGNTLSLCMHIADMEAKREHYKSIKKKNNEQTKFT